MATITIGLVSDTHGYLDPALAAPFDGAAHILHAGDIGPGDILEQLGQWAPTTAVRGNIDGGDLLHLPLEATLDVGGLKLAVLHIAGSPRRPNKTARALIARERPDVLVVGHSHIPVVARVDGTLWINPGAAGRQGFHQHRYAARLHIDNGAIAMDRIELGPRSSKLITTS